MPVRKGTTEDGAPILVKRSDDGHLGPLAEAKTFLGWCVDQRWMKANPLKEVKGVGKHKHGKLQLRHGDLVATVGDAVIPGENNDVADENALHIEEDILESLRDEAAAAGDLAQVAICERALAGDAAAVLECVRVISSAQAQS